MNLKKSYTEKYGYERIITDRNSVLTYTEMDMLKLHDGASYEITEKGKEFVLIVMYGSIIVKGDGFCFENVGKRKSVFDGVAETVYVGKDTEFTVTAVGGDAKICVAKAPADKYFKPAVVRENDVKVKDLGKGAYARKASFIFPETVDANLLYIGEFWVEDGKWASSRRINTIWTICRTRVFWTKYITLSSINRKASAFRWFTVKKAI